jgi:signal transduction histidine kinase
VSGRSGITPWYDAVRLGRSYAEPVNRVSTGLLAHRDVLLALGFCAFGTAELLASTEYDGMPVWPGSRPVAFLATALLTLTLAWRRSRPLTTSLVVFPTVAVFSVAVGAMESTAVFLAILVAVFSGAAYARHPSVVAVLALAAMAVHNSFDPTVRSLGDWFWSGGFIVVAFLLGGAVRNRQIRIVSLERSADDAARAYDERVAAATAAERAAIARELHDIVAHSVSVIVVQAQAGSRSLADDPAMTARLLEVIETTGRSALGDLRRLLRLLSEDGSPVDPSPGLAHVGDLVAGFRDAGLDVDVELPVRLPRLSTAADLAAYRMVQEALTNTIRHAPGASATIRLAVDGGRVDLVVADDGTGPAPVVDLGSGRGLIGMRERVGLAGGRLLQCGPTAQGFRVQAELPLDDDGEQARAGSGLGTSLRG